MIDEIIAGCQIVRIITHDYGGFYDKRGDFDFEIVNFPFLDGDVPHSTSYLSTHSFC